MLVTIAVMVARPLVVVVAVSGVIGAAAAVHAGAAASSSPRCPAAVVRYRPYPGIAPGFRGLPWVAGTPSAQGLVGLLVYWPEAWRAQKMTHATIYTNNHGPGGVPNMKILWAFLSPQAKTALGAGRVVIKGQRLDAPGKTWQQFVEISYTGQNRVPSYASNINLPSAGCWRLELTAGPLHATTVFNAISASG